MRTFTRKGYGRIYVLYERHIIPVSDVIKELDPFEWEYLPDNFIVSWAMYPDIIFTHKFCDLDIDKLTAICWSRGMPIWCFDNGTLEPADYDL